MRTLPLPARLKLTLAVAALLVAWALANLATPIAQDAPPAPPVRSVQTLGFIGVPDELVPDITQEINANILSALGQPAGMDVSGSGTNLGAGLPPQTLMPDAGLAGLPAAAAPAVTKGTGLQGQSVVSSAGGSIRDVFTEPETDSDAGSSGEDESGKDGDDRDGTSNLSGAGGSGEGGERSGDDGKDGDDKDDDKKDDKDDDD